CTPTTSEGREGFKDLSRSPVFTRSPATRISYSRPSSARTCASARSIDWRFSGFEKSVKASLRKGERVSARVVDSTSDVAMNIGSGSRLLGCLERALGCLGVAGRRLILSGIGLRAARNAFHELASALEHLGSFVGEFAPALEHLTSALVEVATLIGEGLTALIGGIHQLLAGFLARSRGV